jgi:uncharacterized membrane protein YkvI/glyoxylase-like metal-dependent hydrolase (beta-lactamase superfamily II)
MGVASVYTGAILGAGFASGREIWQFFGVFGNAGILGVLLVGSLFVGLGMATAVVALKLGTNDMGRVIVPGRHRNLVRWVGGFMALMLFTVLISMSAAGGALFSQQFGLPKIAGGAAVTALVLLTVLGGFDRVSRTFRLVMPVLIAAILALCAGILTGGAAGSGNGALPEPSPLAPTWWLAAVLYISYNILAVIPIMATAAVHAKSARHALGGAALGGGFLTLLAMAILLVLRQDPGLSQAMELPMLAYAGRLAPWFEGVYSGILFFAIYATATGNFFGFTTKIPASSGRKTRIVVFGILAFAIGLVGFRNVIAYMFPLEGFAGILIILLLLMNFITLVRRKDDRGHRSLFTDFEGFDRFDFPEGIHRVTGGFGGEAILVAGTDKTALIDTGMAYCADRTGDNIQKVLDTLSDSEGRPMTLDYIVLTHTHYDHVGGAPTLKRRWPEAVLCGSGYARHVLERDSALKVIRRLGEEARATIGGGGGKPVDVEGLRIERVLADGDILPLGREHLVAMETPGHTNCSMTFVLEPAGLMFASESTGVLEGEEAIHSAVLKSCGDARASLAKCRAYGPSRIISPHYGAVPLHYTDRYWDLFDECLTEENAFILSMRAEGLDEEQMIRRFAHRYWVPERAQEQPKEAFLLNARNIIRAHLKGE